MEGKKFIEEEKVALSNQMPPHIVAQQNRFEGLDLTMKQKEYLLPHFFMIVVGKPGSGKTFLVKQFVYSKQLYYKKFDKVFVVTPSLAKTGIKVPKENGATEFSLDWVKKKINECNKIQYKKMYKLINVPGTSIELQNRTLAQRHLQNFTLGHDMQQGQNQKIPPQVLQYDREQKFFSTGILQTMVGGKAPLIKPDTKNVGTAFMEEPDVEWIEKNIVSTLTPFQQKSTHMNVLFVLDDVIGQIKKDEYNPALAQLFLNRRHLVANGTVSIILVSQKYTMIPARIRSQASWVIVFKLNPSDFETLYKDAVTMPSQKWNELLQYVFGTQDMNKETGEKKYDNLGIWVEYDKYFKNFNLLYQ